MTVDSQPAYISRANDSDDDTSWNLDYILQKNVTTGWTSTQQMSVSPDELALLSGKTFIADIETRSSNNRTYLLSSEILIENGVDISGRVDFIGQAILTFKFGI